MLFEAGAYKGPEIGRYTLLGMFRLRSDTVASHVCGRHLLRLRLEKATALLRLSDSVSEAGMRAGFPDTNYFTRQFRARYGISPREYKRQWNSGMSRRRKSDAP